ncbi:MAG TPA: YceI family protein [Acidimicrobiales bacterium]|nr:YceI family protein [Acidimicrobiales bacterium]
MTLPIASGTYEIDKSHSQLGFSVTHLDISIVKGTFDVFTGSLIVGDTIAATAVSIDAEMASINTGNASRDQHLQGDTFFDVANHPQMKFKSVSISESDEEYELTGELTIKGITNTVTLTGTYNGSAVFPLDDSTHHGFSMSSIISRGAFDVSYGESMVTDEVKLTLEIQFIEPGSD